ncbi:MAG: DUF3043 domain-containing protein [Actinomycetes bacterium]
MFGLFGRKADPPQEERSAATDAHHDGSAGKGRPTPSRKVAQAARKQRLTIPKDPKEAKKATRERDREDRQRARSGMMSGDERYMPDRDKGPAKAFTRDFIDARFTLAEYFIFVAVGVILAGFVPNLAVKSYSTLGFFAFGALIIIDEIVLLIQLRSRTSRQFPDAQDRKGLALYAILRSLQLRRFRVPPPRVSRGGRPVSPKN